MAMSRESEQVTVRPDLDAALDGGFKWGGPAYHIQRDRQLAGLVRFVQAWKALPAERQRAALADAWAFRDVADAVAIGAEYSQRNALLHLAFPDTFESIVSRQHKAAILAAFTGQIPDQTGDEDRDLLSLRTELQRREGGPISFYAGTLERRWRPTTTAVPQRGWLVRGANVQGRNLVPDWLAGGYCSLAYPELPELRPGPTRSQLHP